MFTDQCTQCPCSTFAHRMDVRMQLTIQPGNFESILYDKNGSIAYVTVNRPEVLNAVSRKTVAELTAAFEDAPSDQHVRGVIVTGTGDKAFIAGADIAEIARTTPLEALFLSREGQTFVNLIENLGKPVVAAVNGVALGGGCETALACTIRIASENARFGQPEIRLGLIPGWGGTQRLPQLVGLGRAMQLILTGETISAAEALRIGLVNEVVPHAQLLTRAEAILAQIGANAPIAVGYAIEAMNRGKDCPLSVGLALEAALFSACPATADKAEGTKAFLEKRAPKFEGR